MVNGTTSAVAFTCSGEYLKTHRKFPKAKGQKYAIPTAAFFEAKDGSISRITSYFSLLAGWIKAISQAQIASHQILRTRLTKILN
jgi:hypothetical protein